MASLNSQLLFVNSMIDYITTKCAGGHDSDAISSDSPRKVFFLGSLSPKRSDADDEIDSRYIQEEGKTSIRSQRMSVGFLVESKTIGDLKLTVTPQGSIFIKTEVDSDAQSDALNADKGGEREKNKIWKRFNFSDRIEWSYCEGNPENIKVSFKEALASAASADLSGKRGLDGIWDASVDIETSEFSSDYHLVKVSLTNNAKDPQKPDGWERSIFNCRLRIEIVGARVGEFSDRYMYEDHPQQYYYDFRPINCQAFWSEKGSIIETRHYGRFEQPNIRPKATLPGVDLLFDSLRDERSLLASVDSLIGVMETARLLYEQTYSADKSGYQEREGQRQGTWEEGRSSLESYSALIDQIKVTRKLLGENRRALKCLADMHGVFSNYYKSNNPSSEIKFGWRIFQFVFILACLPSIINNDGEDVAKVLHVDTGGGKSEAYFGLVVFAAFWERSGGKKDGTTALVKFPLRMLSIQQLDRLASVIVHAEKIRKENEETYQGESFSLGFYVGKSDDFPNSLAKLRESLYNNNELIDPAPESIILTGCPLCGKPSDAKVRLKDDLDGRRVLHQCDVCKEIFFIYTSDVEIFHRRPTVIVSTVDKWAAISLQSKVRNLLGGSGSDCPHGHGFISSGDVCEDGSREIKCEEKGKNAHNSDGPILSIQDEMHLLREGFGVISAHFEGAIENLVKATSKRGLQHVAMSATLNGTRKQIQELYAKDCVIIPGRCPNGPGSEGDLFYQRYEGPNRIIIGLKPNFRDNHYASLITLLHFSTFIITAQKELNANPDDFCIKFGCVDNKEAQDLINQYLLPITYHLKVQDAEDMARLQREFIRENLLNEHGSEFNGMTLTGGSGLKELKEAMRYVSEYLKNYDPSKVGTPDFVIRPLYCTSVISHGVDLEDLNFMVFQGIPFSTSEYIQALSRVGRSVSKVGVVLVWFYPNRIRDDSFFRNFVRYHETLDHQVRPVPIRRDARLGKYQTINSLFTAAIINHLSEIKGAPLWNKGHIADLTANDIQAIINYIVESYGSERNIDVRKEVEDRINMIKHSSMKDNDDIIDILAKCPNRYYRSQTGMRGIQRELILKLNINDGRIV
ncbi:MAG: hypothetical protein A4E29_01321 [Methanomassiliicoccales archaeon PtaB.Bin134]|nr:MAG: hypothetical protein A4E29_01321 [Methanomassiliicoccales archaeon PtaB.Bin134]